MTTTIPSQLLLRDARDRLIDLLGFGQTYPLRDVDVQEEQRTVDFNQASQIDIEPGQKGVKYEFYENDQPAHDKSQPANATFSQVGNGDLTAIPGPRITEDRTFRIRAEKTANPQRYTYLLQTAVIKVGLDTGLSAYIDGELLNASLKADTDPRVVDYGSPVTVQVIGSQLGAQYSLAYSATDAKGTTVDLTTSPPILGTGGNISLPINPNQITEDTKIKIRVTRDFPPAEKRPALKAELTAVLPLAVRPKKDIAFAVDGSPSPLVDPLQATITLVQSQKNETSYTVLTRKLTDSDFKFTVPSNPKCFAIAIPPSPDLPLRFGDTEAQKKTPPMVYVRPPDLPAPLAAVSVGYQPGPSNAGSGDKLSLATGPVAEDSIAVILATKNHRNPAGELWGTSTVLLDKAAVVLPRPSQQPGLGLTVAPSTKGAGSTLTVTGGQAGVYYHFRLIGSSAEIGLPAYFHRADDQSLNRGIGLMRIQTDFAIAAQPQSSSIDPSSPVSPHARGGDCAGAGRG